MPGADASDRVFRLGLALILLLAAALRLLYLGHTIAHPELSDLLILDSIIYDRMAGVIAGGDWRAGREAFDMGPLYPYFLAVLRGLFGEGHDRVYVVQQILGLASVALTALLARRCFGVRAALVAAALIALYGAMAMLETKVMASSLAVFTSLLTLQLLLLARERGWRFAALVPGATLGLACLARPNTLLFLPIAIAWLLWDGRGWRAPQPRLQHARVLAALAFALGAAAAIAPATLRNLAVADELVLISSHGGLTFYQSNNERALGLFTRLPELSGTPTDIRRKGRRIAEQQLGRVLDGSEISRYWTRKGLDFLIGNPLEAALLVSKKLHYWLGSDEHSSEYVLPVERDLIPWLWLMPVPFGVILALALLGARSAGFGRPETLLLHGFVLANLATILVFYFSSRYRLPAVPVLAVFAGGGLVEAVDRVRGSRGGSGFRVWLAAALLLGAYSLYPWTDHIRAQSAQQLYNYGQIHTRRGRYREALESFQRALAVLPERWPLHLDVAQAYERIGDPQAALREYERVLESRPEHPGARRQATRLRALLERAPQP